MTTAKIIYIDCSVFIEWAKQKKGYSTPTIGDGSCGFNVFDDRAPDYQSAVAFHTESVDHMVIIKHNLVPAYGTRAWGCELST